MKKLLLLLPLLAVSCYSPSLGESYARVKIVEDEGVAAVVVVLWFIFIAMTVLGTWIVIRLGAIRNSLRDIRDRGEGDDNA